MTSAATKTAKPTEVMSFCADVLSADGPHAQPPFEQLPVVESHMGRDKQRGGEERAGERPSLPVVDRAGGNEDEGEEDDRSANRRADNAAEEIVHESASPRTVTASRRRGNAGADIPQALEASIIRGPGRSRTPAPAPPPKHEHDWIAQLSPNRSPKPNISMSPAPAVQHPRSSRRR